MKAFFGGLVVVGVIVLGIIWGHAGPNGPDAAERYALSHGFSSVLTVNYDFIAWGCGKGASAYKVAGIMNGQPTTKTVCLSWPRRYYSWYN